MITLLEIFFMWVGASPLVSCKVVNMMIWSTYLQNRVFFWLDMLVPLRTIKLCLCLLLMLLG